MDSIPEIERCKTGIDMLDDRILKGGLPRGSVTLVSGSSGVGKTTMCSQFLFNGAKNTTKMVCFLPSQSPFLN
jgi:RecA-superfamily ATPases implicated in signal transduction